MGTDVDTDCLRVTRERHTSACSNVLASPRLHKKQQSAEGQHACLMLMGIADYANAKTGEFMLSVRGVPRGSIATSVSGRRLTCYPSLEASGEHDKAARPALPQDCACRLFTLKGYAQPVDNSEKLLLQPRKFLSQPLQVSDIVTPQDLAPSDSELPRKTYPNNPAKSCARTLTRRTLKNKKNLKREP